MWSLKMNRSALILVVLVCAVAALFVGLWLTPTPPSGVCAVVTQDDPRTDALIDRAIAGGGCVVVER